jgi:hypothetical protein
MEQNSAGDNIASYCTKCKLPLDHTIVAMKDGSVAKVKCRTCGSTHKFRDPAAAPKPRRARSKDADGTARSVTWESALAEAKGRPHPYRMDAKYRIGDVVDHDRFGKGIVLKLYVNKCDVLFQDRERLMASGN